MISPEKVRKAADSINNQIIKTLLIHSHSLTHTFKNRIYLMIQKRVDEIVPVKEDHIEEIAVEVKKAGYEMELK